MAEASEHEQPQQPHSVFEGMNSEVNVRAQVPANRTLNIQVRREGATKEASTSSSPSISRKKTDFTHITAFLNRIGLHLPGLTTDGVLITIALVIYLFSRLFRLADFPIYFFTDEAIQTVLAADLVRDHFIGADGQFLPTYFLNSYQYNLGVSVYVQLLPYLLIGKSVWVTRGICAVISAFSALFCALIVKQGFRRQYSWAAALFLTVTPAWFLHSRTAFETGLAVTFFAGFLYFYLRYRQGALRLILAAVLCAALMYYSYSPARAVILLLGGLLFLSDIGYHWKNRKIVLIALVFTMLLAVPLLRFQLTHADENLRHLTVLNSYWIRPIPISEKLAIYAREFLKGLSPAYWYMPVDIDMARHTMKGYGHVLWWSAPFALIGLLASVRNLKRSENRVLIFSWLAAPAGAALVAVGITRLLVMVIPLALLSGLGFSITCDWLQTTTRFRKIFAGVRRIIPKFMTLGRLCYVLLSITAGYMVWDALVNGPLWYKDYGLEGMQYGARQVFSIIKETLAEKPQTYIYMSTAWTNGTDTVARFFFPDPTPFEMGSIEAYTIDRRPLDENTLFILIPDEYKLALDSGKFKDIQLEGILPYPNGNPGFYFLRMQYADDIDAQLEAEKAARKRLLEDWVEINGFESLVKFSYLDMGPINNLFDGKPETLVRSFEANPLIVEIEPPQPIKLNGLTARIGGPATEIQLEVTQADGKQRMFKDTVGESPEIRDHSFDFVPPITITHLRLSIRSVNDGEPSHVHLWEITLK